MNLLSLPVVLYLGNRWVGLDNMVHAEVGGAVEDVQGGPVSRLIVQQDAARLNFRLLPQEQGERILNRRREGILKERKREKERERDRQRVRERER